MWNPFKKKLIRTFIRLPSEPWLNEDYEGQPPDGWFRGEKEPPGGKSEAAGRYKNGKAWSESPLGQFGGTLYIGPNGEASLTTTASNGPDWMVTIVGEKGTRVRANRLPRASWLAVYHQVRYDMTGWEVDSHYLPDGERGWSLEIVIPGRAKPLMIPHPTREGVREL